MKKIVAGYRSSYEEEDKKVIALLTEEIVENAQFIKNIYEIKPKRIPVTDHKNHMWAFYGEKELSVALYMFFASQYNAKMIAKKCYQGDEDDIIRETMDFYDFPVGRVKCPDGTSRESRLVEAKMKILNFLPPDNERDPDTHMPFELMGFRIVSDDMADEMTEEEARSIVEKRVLNFNNAEIKFECNRRGIKSNDWTFMEQKLVEAMVRELLGQEEIIEQVELSTLLSEKKKAVRN